MKNFYFLPALLFFACTNDPAVKNTHTISGKIGYGDYPAFIEGLSVQLYSNDALIASQDGPEYSFTGLEEGIEYTIVPIVPIGSKDGISTLDIVLTRKFIEGIEPLNPIQQLAADFNKNNVVTYEDTELMADCIVNNVCTSYRFISEDYDGQGAGFMDRITIPNLNSDQTINFVPVKLGDVNGTIF